MKKQTKKLGSEETSKETKKKEKDYKLEVHLNDMIIKSKGDTLLEAIKGFVSSDDFPLAVKTKVFLKYSKGEVERHKILGLGSARTIFKRLRFDDDQANFLAEKLTHELTY